MNKAIFTSSYFAPISYYIEIFKCDKIIIESQENYQKKSYRSRCYIAGPFGKQMLNIPINRPNANQTKIQEATLATDQNWRKQHWNSIITAYNSSPFFLYYQDEIEAVLFANHKTLWELNNEILKLTLELLQIKTKIEYNSEYQHSIDSIKDNRNRINSKNTINNSEYIQVFGDKNGFINDLSILDLIFNLGPEANSYLFNNKNINLD